MQLHTKILLGLGSGALAGSLGHAFGAGAELDFFVAQVTEPLGQLFLRLLLLLVIPLVGASILAGVGGLGDVRRLGRVGLRCLWYTVAVSAVAVLIGLTLANTIRPGQRVDPDIRAQLAERYAHDTEQTIAKATAGQDRRPPLAAVVQTLVPANVFHGLAQNPPDILGLMFFAVLLGIGLTLAGESGAPVLRFFESLADVSGRCIELVMRAAPYAVFCLVFTMTARFGAGLLVSLGWFVGAVLGGLAIQMFVVYPVALLLFARVSPREFFRRIGTVMLTAFSTSSSTATLPTAMRVSEERLGIPRSINGFVLTLGATANQNGTALFEGVTILFLAQLSGTELSIGQQLIVLYLAILGGIGTAGVPAGSIPFVVVVLASLGVDPQMIAVVLGVDRLLDMCRTVVNVVGDLTLAAYVARKENTELMPAEPGHA